MNPDRFQEALDFAVFKVAEVNLSAKCIEDVPAV
jgi:hypothetical protein